MYCLKINQTNTKMLPMMSHNFNSYVRANDATGIPQKSLLLKKKFKNLWLTFLKPHSTIKQNLHSEILSQLPALCMIGLF